MRAAIAGVLPIHKRIERLAIAAVAVRETEFQRLLHIMQRRIDRLAAIGLQVLHDQVEQPVARLKRLAVIPQLEPRVQVAVMPQPPLHVLGAELDLLEHLRIGLKLDQRPVRLPGRLAAILLLELALLERGFGKLPLAIAAHPKHLRQRVDRLGADAVQPDAELKDVIVIFCPRIDLGNTIHHLAQWNAPPEIPHGHRPVLDGDLHLLAVAHDELVNGVINHLFEQDVAPVIVMRTIPDAANVHAGAQPDVLQRRERLNLALVINVLLIAGHSFQPRKYQRSALACQS